MLLFNTNMTNGYAWSISLHHKINIFSTVFQYFHNFVLGISVRYTHQDVTYVTEIKFAEKSNLRVTPPFPPNEAGGVIPPFPPNEAGTM